MTSIDEMEGFRSEVELLHNVNGFAIQVVLNQSGRMNRTVVLEIKKA